MTLHRQRQLVRRHADAVVGDLDPVDPAAGQRHRDPRGAGIQRVFHQLLYRRRRPLDDLAGGDAVDDGGGQDADYAHQVSPRSVRNRAISPVVEPSWAPGTVPGSSSGRIPPASCLPSSTPHWSKLSMPQSTPSTNTLCS